MINSYIIKNDIIENLINYITICINSDSIDTSTYIKIIILLMEKLENLQIKFKSYEKKQYVIITICEIIKIYDENNTIIQSLKNIIDNQLIGEIIDIICSASKGEININKTCYSCFSLFKIK
jgi:Ca2+-binding EF-hand superfamily protein